MLVQIIWEQYSSGHDICKGLEEIVRHLIMKNNSLKALIYGLIPRDSRYSVLNREKIESPNFLLEKSFKNRHRNIMFAKSKSCAGYLMTVNWTQIYIIGIHCIWWKRVVLNLLMIFSNMFITSSALHTDTNDWWTINRRDKFN